VQGYNATSKQLEMMMFLISGNCEGMVELLLRMLEEKEGRLEGMDIEQFMWQLEEVVVILDEQVTSVIKMK
jgi:hypothetical protein